ncbi:uncharacterized protein LOC131948099 [Physella acuta]|uniref:uncharacterized protein LOC131948099 n=1 Tax=Physella acuta TaxID=109671 RepID=UPI0027DDBCE0|nr:uncharacterized protein LOC131948099 [Physella acuta]
MNCLLLVTCFSAIFVASLALVSNWNQEMRDYVLELHNDKRRKEGGCQINKLIYDMDLENQARRWAEGCVYKHESLPGRGENLAWNSMEQPEKELILGGFTAWFDEKNLYSYGQDSCSMSCHYTQLVWDKTQKVGCWSTRCPNLRNAYQNAWWLVCFYTPMGNWNRQRPYQKSCKSPCRKGQTEENGLCLGDMPDESEERECKDENPRCQEWANRNQCVSNPAYMKEKCRLACKVCKP